MKCGISKKKLTGLGSLLVLAEIKLMSGKQRDFVIGWKSFAMIFICWLYVLFKTFMENEMEIVPPTSVLMHHLYTK